MIEDKLEEVALRHEVPIELLRKLIDWEREAITLQNRRMSKRIRDALAEFLDSGPANSGDVS